MTKRLLDLSVADVSTSGPLTPPKRRAKKKPRVSMKLAHPVHGTIEVTTMREWQGDLCLLAQSDAADDAPKWIHIAKPGKFNGHGSGPFELSEGVFRQIIDNFKAHPEHIPFDFEHASEADPSSGTIPSQGAPAQGWISDF